MERPKRVHAPSAVSSYSNYGAALAGEAVVYASGKPYERLIEDEILNPLGMVHTTFREPRPAKAGLPGALLPVLHALQEEFGYVHRDAIPLVAGVLNLSRAEVYGVVTFYHDFRMAPPGRHVLKLGRAEACQSTGGERLAARAEAKLGVAFGNTTADGEISLEPVYCLGLCSVSPAAMLDGHVHARLDPRKLDTLIAEADR